MNSLDETGRSLTITKMMCVPTDHTYNEVYQRSFSLGLTPGQTDDMRDFFTHQGVGDNAMVSMSSAATQLQDVVKLSTTPVGKVYIPNGWSTQRLMYLLEVEEYINSNTSLTHYIQGYSEYHDPSYTGALDPNMSFYINSITTITRTRNPYTNSLDSRLAYSYNVILDMHGDASYQMVTNPENSMELIRPTDIITNLHADNLYSPTGEQRLSIKTAALGNGANVSTKKNNDPLRYFTNTVNAVIAGKSIETGYNTPESVLGNANGIVSEQSITTNTFIYRIAKLTGNLEPGYFTLNLLSQLDPSVNTKITLINTGGIMRDVDPTTASLNTENTESMLNYTEESSVAQTFINSLTAAMSENLVTVISGTVTNIQGNSITAISNIQSFIWGVDITPYGNRIINYINTVIMPQITMNNLRLVSIVFDCDLLGDTTVSVSVDNYNPVIYRLPTFTDSLYSPVVTNAASKEAVIGDFDTVVDTVMSMESLPQQGAYYGN